MSGGFTYDENANMKEIDKFGVKWYRRVQYATDNFPFYSLINSKFGEFIISKNALDNIPESDNYKVLSLIFEQKFNNNIYSVTMKDEENKLHFSDSNYISVSMDEFLNRFPNNLIEKQNRALLLLYKMYPEYGQQIREFDCHMFFAKNTIELGFIIESMVTKNWVKVGIKKSSNGEPFFSLPFTITDDGWVEIENAVQNLNKKQVFIAMKFKDMDNIYNAIYRAVEDAHFIPLRIDKKEHTNQISNEIQYEISRSVLIVADVTGQNQGVYFEAGYAIGLNIPVIWTCNEKEINEIHFDTRQYNTILWKDEDDLYEKLKKRIIAVMGLRENQNQGHSHA
jgi:nucleoside 2-deoxyribosyltransferase